MISEITDLRTALVERDAEIAVLRADWKKVTHENGVVRAAAQQGLEALEDCVPVIPNGIAYEHSQTVITALTAALESKTIKKIDYAWECNECGSQEYSMGISEDDVQELGCGRCGSSEWHKEIAR